MVPPVDVPDDAWVSALKGDATAYDAQSWPAPQPAQCADGEAAAGYLDVGYLPLRPGDPIGIETRVTTATGEMPSTLEVVPVFTSADATLPALDEVSTRSISAKTGAEKVLDSTKRRLLASWTFAVATLPDGSTATTWQPEITGCGSTGSKLADATSLSLRVGNAEGVPIGDCANGEALSSAEQHLAVPADGTRIRIYATGGTTRTLVRITEFQWRDAP